MESPHVETSCLRCAEHEAHRVSQDGGGGGHGVGVWVGVSRGDAVDPEFVQRNRQALDGKALERRDDARGAVLAAAGASAGRRTGIILDSDAANVAASVADGVDVVGVKSGVIGAVVLQDVVFVDESLGRGTGGGHGGGHLVVDAGDAACPVDVPIVAGVRVVLTGVVAFVVDVDFAVLERSLGGAANVVVDAASDGITKVGFGSGIAGGGIIQKRNGPGRLLLRAGGAGWSPDQVVCARGHVVGLRIIQVGIDAAHGDDVLRGFVMCPLADVSA